MNKKELEKIKMWSDDRLEFGGDFSCSKTKLLKDYWDYTKSSLVHIAVFGKLVRHALALETIKIKKENHFAGVRVKDV